MVKVRTTSSYEIILKSQQTGRHKIIELIFNEECQYIVLDHFGNSRYRGKSTKAANGRTIELVNEHGIPCLIFDSYGNKYGAQLCGELDGPYDIDDVIITEAHI